MYKQFYIHDDYDYDDDDRNNINTVNSIKPE